MSGGIAFIPQTAVPHYFPDTHTTAVQPFTSDYPNMNNRKRKADDDLGETSMDRMSSSPSPAPSSLPRPSFASNSRIIKRARTNMTGKSLSLPRLMETLSPEEMRTLLNSICDRHPEIGAEIASTAPRPSVSSALSVLASYQAATREAFPYGDRPTSEYSYNRVRQSLLNLLDALKDYTPHFLPPNESQVAVSLQYLDGATEVVHQLPDWDSYQHNRHKDEAYEDISRAWATVVGEAAKRGGGLTLQIRGWDRKLAKHNDMSKGRMSEALNEMRSHTGWMDHSSGSSQHADAQENLSIRQQLLSGTYGASQPIEVGPW